MSQQILVEIEIVCKCGAPLVTEGGSGVIAVEPCVTCMKKRWGEGKIYGGAEVGRQIPP